MAVPASGPLSPDATFAGGAPTSAGLVVMILIPPFVTVMFVLSAARALTLNAKAARHTNTLRNTFTLVSSTRASELKELFCLTFKSGSPFCVFDWPTANAQLPVWESKPGDCYIVGPHLSVHNCTLSGNRLGTRICRSLQPIPRTAPFLASFLLTVTWRTLPRCSSRTGTSGSAPFPRVRKSVKRRAPELGQHRHLV